MNELLTPAEAAKRLRIVVGTLAVWRCTQRVPLPFVKLGRKIFYRQQDIEEFINANVHPGDGPWLNEGRTRKRATR